MRPVEGLVSLGNVACSPGVPGAAGGGGPGWHAGGWAVGDVQCQSCVVSGGCEGVTVAGEEAGISHWRVACGSPELSLWSVKHLGPQGAL